MTVVPDQYLKIFFSLIQPTTKRLYGPGLHEIKVIESVATTLVTEKANSQQDLYIVECLEEPLLGRPVIKALKSAKSSQYGQNRKALTLERISRTILKPWETWILDTGAQPFSTATSRILSLFMKKKV